MLSAHTTSKGSTSAAEVEEAILILGDKLSEESKTCIRHLSNFKTSEAANA